MRDAGLVRRAAILLGAVAIVLVASPAAWATNAATCSQADVQSAVNATSSGGTVAVPAGNCTWTASVVITNKSLTITGAGIDVTTITGNTPGNSLVIANLSTTDTFNISGFTMRLQSAGSSYGMIDVNVANAEGYPAVSFRIHHIKMLGDPSDGVSQGGRFVVASGVYGVVDHCSFITQTPRGAGNVTIMQDNNFSTSNTYHTPQVLGDANALYVEDCDFEFVVANQGNGAIDNYSGGRYVFRYNTVRNNNVGNHGWDSGNRGVRTFEIYGNVFIADSMIGGMEMFGPRSGTGVLWGNSVKNIQPQLNSTGYIDFFAPRTYAGMSQQALFGNVNLNARATGYYPTAPWGQRPYPGTTTVDDGKENFATGYNPIDGNQMPAGHFDPENSRTVSDLVTTAGSRTITSATAHFVTGDLTKDLVGTNITPRRVVTDGSWSAGSTTVSSNTINFSAGDVGRYIGDPNSKIPHNTTITAVINSTTATMSTPATATGSGLLILLGPWITSITNSTTAVLNSPATASGTGGTLTVGYSDQGYPLADQPGRGSFAVANRGNWPHASGYSDADFEALDPTYLFLNHWQTVNSGMSVLTDTVPPPSVAGLNGDQAYIKHLREFYDDPDVKADVFAKIPATCTTGEGYWATDRGGDWNTTNSSSSDGALYRCTATNTWTLYYTPLSYPHPFVQGQSLPSQTPAAPTPSQAPAAPTNVRIQ